MIKLIVSDVDGTIIDKFNQFNDEEIKKIHEKIDQGVEFMYASGRDFNMMSKVFEKSDIYGEMIINNGTQFRNYEGTINECHPMKEEAFRKMIEILQKYNYHISIHTTKGKYILVDYDTYWNWHVELLKADRKVNSIDDLPDATFFRREGYLNDCTSVKSLDEMYLQGALPLKVDARHLNSKEAQGVYERLSVIPHLNISSSYEDNIEITCDDLDKGIMLKKVLQQKGISLDEVATFGDGLNDVCMLEDFPYSFAPSNACTLAKEKAAFCLTKSGGNGAIQEGIEILEKMNLL